MLPWVHCRSPRPGAGSVIMKAIPLLFLLFTATTFAGPVVNGGFDNNPQTPAAINPWQTNNLSRIALTGCTSSTGTSVTCASTTNLAAGMRISGAGLVTSPVNATLIVALPITSTSFGVSGGTITTCPAALLGSNSVPPPALVVGRTTSGPQAGGFSLRVDGRDCAVDGVKQNISGLVNGARYTTRFFIKLDAPAQVRGIVQLAATGAVPFIMAEAVIRSDQVGQWIEIQGTSTLSWSGSLGGAQLYFAVEQIYTQGGAAPAGVFPGYNLDSLTMEVDTDGDGYWDSEEVPGNKGTNPLLADSDLDTMPDKWEITHLLNPNDSADAASDPDHDGHSSKIEYWACTNPQSTASYPGLTSDPQASPATKALLYYLQTRGARGNGRYLTGQHAQDIAAGDYTTYVAGLNALMTSAGFPSWVSILSIAAEGPSAAQPLQITTSAPVMRSYLDAGGLGLIHWTPRNPFTNGHNSDRTGVDITSLITPGTTANVRMTGWMDAVAAEIAACGPDHPVIFRPFSEQNGNWNWYGRISQDEFSTLYHWLRNYFMNTKGLHNIIWAIEHHIGVHRPTSPSNTGVAMDYYYPGDDAIDLVGFSVYVSGWNPGFDADAQSRLHPKAFAITEGGPPATEDDVPNAYNSTYLPALDAWYPRSAFFVIWNSWNTGPNVAIKDNPNYVPLLTDPRVTNRETLNYLHTTAHWQAVNGLQNRPLDADEDQDGLANVLEAAMGLNPLVPSAASPTQGFITLGGQTYATITFIRDPTIQDLTITAEWSSDLLNWSSTATTEISRVPQNGLETITVRSNTPAEGGSQFLRVRVSGP